jgi:hypothetical protein
MTSGRLTKYKEEYPEMFLAAMSEGKTVVQFAASIGVHVDTLHEWRKVHPIFSEAYSIGRNKAEAHWTTYTVNNFTNTKFNTNLFKFFMTNCFGWSDKKEVTQDIALTEGPIRRVRQAEDAYK